VLTANPAVKAITDEIAKDPKNASLYFQRAKTLVDLKEDTMALRDYKMAASLDTNKAEYFSAVGDLLFEHKDIDEALVWIKKAITINPNDVKAHLKVAKLFLYLQQHETAIQELNFVLRKDVYNPEAYFLKAMVYKDRKDTAHAISNFQTTLQVAPDYKDAVVQLGLLYSAKNDPLAIRYLDNAYLIDSNDVFPIFARGEYYLNNKDTVRAKQEFRKCIVRNTHYIDAYFNLGFIYLQQDSLDKAFRQYDLVTKLDPTNPAGFFNRGLCNEMLNRPQDAVLDYRKALVIDSGYQSPKKALQRLGVGNDGKPKK
jgi:tetratricopeptide (TPR) repeat protein